MKLETVVEVALVLACVYAITISAIALNQKPEPAAPSAKPDCVQLHSA